MKKRMKRSIIILLTMVIVAAFSMPAFAASDLSQTGSVMSIGAAKKVPLKKITLNKTSATLKVGKTLKLKVKYSPSNTTASKKVKWTTSNKKVAVVSSSGKVTAKKAGKAVITATVGKKKAVCRITVKKSSSDDSKYYLNVSEAYTLLNKFRTTKSNQWYWNESDTVKVRTYGLLPLKKDAALEKIAKLRAKEQWIQYYENNRATHDRPNGQKWYTAYDGFICFAENLAWGHTSCQHVINSWAETDCSYRYQGHRRNMLSGLMTKVGIACYSKNGKTCWIMSLGR